MASASGIPTPLHQSRYHAMFNSPARGAPNFTNMLSSTAGLSEEEALNDMKNLADDLANKDRLSGPFRDDLHEFAEVGPGTLSYLILQFPESRHPRIST